jgi:7-dehydrocholesterol reductase
MSHVTQQGMTMTTPKKALKLTGDWSSGDGILPGREAYGPLFLMTTTPVFSIVFYHVVALQKGDFLGFAQVCWQEGLFPTVYSIWPSPWDVETWQMILAFLGFELLLQRYLPGKRFEATVTPKGNRPVYTANGMMAYLVTLATLLILTYLGIIRPARVHEKFGNILSSMNVLALAFCALLLAKGHLAPSTTDSGTNGNWITDFYWGMELYPNILGWDVKMFTNCRAGMMFWAVGILCFAHYNMEQNQGTLQLGMAVNVALQLVYITKFFYWEMGTYCTEQQNNYHVQYVVYNWIRSSIIISPSAILLSYVGYMCSMDIQHDRAGYYICWGCLVWVPAVYTSHSFYLAQHAPELTGGVALLIFLFGFAMIFMNFDSDNQRYVFRQTNGKCVLWGRTPRKIEATYVTEKGETRTSLLLVDGYWRWSRHFHYVPEILASLAWSAPALATGLVGPYFYVMFLTILLTDRAYRDDDRCRKKYAQHWDEYCKTVPYKIVPGIV